MTVRQLKILLALLLVNILYIFLLGKFIRNSSIDLHKVSSIKGEISEIGVDTFKWNSSRFKSPRNHTVYYFKIKNSPSVYYFPYLKKNKEVFQELKQNLPVSVYFKKKHTINRNDTQEIIQLEKENKILISKKNQEYLNRILSIIMVIAILLTNWISFSKLKNSKFYP